MHQHGSNPMGIEMMIPVIVIVMNHGNNQIVINLFSDATKGVVVEKNSTAFM